jgi:hypothetical protein
MLVRATTCGLNFTRLTSESQLSVNDKESAPVIGAASASINPYAASRMSSPVAAFGCNP